jgi:PhzF family phenazine biosynthesis protein
MDVEVSLVHSFTKQKNSGNPAGVVLNPPKNITDDQMKNISKKLDVSETAFVFPSKTADMHVRFFSPTVEVNLCGHATIAAFYCIAQQQSISSKKQMTFIQQTKAGHLPVTISYDTDGIIEKIMMKQTRLQQIDKTIAFPHLAKALRIDEEMIRKDIRPMPVSTGLFTLPVCVKSFETLKQMMPDFTLVSSFCENIGVGSLHVFTFETLDPGSLYHARNFAPLYGINEDPVTGTANGAICSYLKKQGFFKDEEIIVEQGDIIDHAGRVHVLIRNDDISVGGTATIVEEKTISV